MNGEKYESQKGKGNMTTRFYLSLLNDDIKHLIKEQEEFGLITGNLWIILFLRYLFVGSEVLEGRCHILSTNLQFTFLFII